MKRGNHENLLLIHTRVCELALRVILSLLQDLFHVRRTGNFYKPVQILASFCAVVFIRWKVEDQRLSLSNLPQITVLSS